MNLRIIRFTHLQLAEHSTNDKYFSSAVAPLDLISLYNNLSDVLFLAIIHDQQISDASRAKNIHEHQMILDAVVSNQQDEVKRLIAFHYDKL